jgi:hypothetical protein
LESAVRQVAIDEWSNRRPAYDEVEGTRKALLAALSATVEEAGDRRLTALPVAWRCRYQGERGWDYHTGADPAYPTDEIVAAEPLYGGEQTPFRVALEKISAEQRIYKGHGDFDTIPALSADEAQAVAREALSAQSPSDEVAVIQQPKGDDCRAQSGVVERRWRHKKRGTTYTEIGRGKAQAEAGIFDMANVVIYRSDDDGSLWARSSVEFLDGRFEEIAPNRQAQPAVIKTPNQSNETGETGA